MAITSPHHRILIFGSVLFVMTSISVFIVTSKFAVKLVESQKTKAVQQIYDPDLYKKTAICPFAKDAYRVPYNKTICSDKTMLSWYVPWMHYDVWEKFREAIEERKRKEAERLEIMVTSALREKENEYKREEYVYNKESIGYVVDNDDSLRDLEEVSKVACTILSVLLIVLTLVALGEYIREKLFGPYEDEDFFGHMNGPGMNIRLGMINGHILNFDQGLNNGFPPLDGVRPNMRLMLPRRPPPPPARRAQPVHRPQRNILDEALNILIAAEADRREAAEQGNPPPGLPNLLPPGVEIHFHRRNPLTGAVGRASRLIHRRG